MNPGTAKTTRQEPSAARATAPHSPVSVRYRGRFAPSPTGALHFGSLLAAFGSWLAARRSGGDWLVRIEDLDPPREVAGSADAQLRTLSAFGLVADGPVMRQSERGAQYRQALDGLLASGAAFECHCSRSDLLPQGGIHRACVTGTRRADPSIRLRVADGTRIDFEDSVHGRISQDVAVEVGDFVLRRADGYWAYQLAVVVDDAAQDITDVVRGADLLASTARQILLQRTLGLPTPRYLHLPLIVDGDGRKLSKSSAALPVRDDAPLTALRAAWEALGQDRAALPGTDDVAKLLAAATLTFDPGSIPRTPTPVLAALHNGFAINAE
jgi:glutamyl-Q tRNA(Asp) synthetase